VRAHLRARVARAQHSVVATSPYLIPGRSGMALLGALRERGVHVSLVTNSMAAVDEPFAFIGYLRYRTRLLQMGVDLFELSPARVAHSRRFHLDGRSTGQLHAKAAVIDGRTVFIGSMNLDPRSDRHNTEVGVFVDSEILSAQLLHLVDLVRSQGGYRVVLTADGVQRWHQDGDSTQHAGAPVDPETSRGQRFLLWLLDPLVPEDLL
jgi:putative cardiolipin synthase